MVDINATVQDANNTTDIEKNSRSALPSTPETSSDNSPASLSAEPPLHGDAVYGRFGRGRKRVFVAVLSFCAIASPISSTGSLTAVPAIALTFGTTGSVINIGNGLYVAMMGLSAFLWGSLSTLTGRQPVLYTSILTFFLFSLATALAPNLAAFFVFRVLTGFSGTGLLIAGAGCVGDLYKPTERGAALGWFSSGVLIGPAVGPVLGGVLVTYGSWRDIFWLQAGMAGLGSVLAIAIIPETIHDLPWPAIPKGERVQATLAALNPARLLALFQSLNVTLVALASSSLVWNMYSYLTPIVYVINPRLHLTTPLQSGLMYLAPGSGYLLGTFFGGKWADYTVRRWIRKRGQHRVPEDRLRCVIPFMGVGVPASMLVYGWCLEFNRGGLPTIVVVMFVQGLCQLMVFPALNSYCLDILPARSAEVIASNYLVRYIFAAMGSSLALPAIDSIGVGWFSTISAVFIFTSCLTLVWVIRRQPVLGVLEEGIIT